MSPISPAFVIAAAAAVGALYTLHHLRIQPKQRKTATLIFWKAAALPQQARAIWSSRFTHFKTFILLSAILLLIAVAFTTARWGNVGQSNRQSVIVIDCGAAMATDAAAGGSVMQAAISKAAVDIDSMSGSTALITAGNQPLLLCQNEPHAVLKWNLKTISPQRGASSSAQALFLAASMLTNQGGEIHWYTSQAALPDDLPPSIVRGIHPHFIAESPSVAIINVAYLPDARIASRGILHVQLAGKKVQPMTVEIAAENRIQTVDTGATDVSVPGISADGREITVQLNGAAGPLASHVARFTLPDYRPLTFRIIGDIPSPLRHVLSSIGSESETGDIVVTTNEKNVSGPASIVVAKEGPTVARQTRISVADSEVTRSISLDGADTSVGPELPPSLTPLLKAGSSIVAGWQQSGSRRTLYLSDCLLSEDAGLPKTAAFPVLLSRACRLLVKRADHSAVVSLARAAEDPLWSNSAYTTVPDVPASVISTASSAAVVLSPNRWEVTWTQLVLLGAVILIAIESILFAYRKIV